MIVCHIRPRVPGFAKCETDRFHTTAGFLSEPNKLVEARFPIYEYLELNSQSVCQRIKTITKKARSGVCGPNQSKIPVPTTTTRPQVGTLYRICCDLPCLRAYCFVSVRSERRESHTWSTIAVEVVVVQGISMRPLNCLPSYTG